MQSSIAIIGAGFAGVWSALSAKRLVNLNKGQQIRILVIAPEQELVIRPRLYEANSGEMAHPLADLFQNAGIDFLQGRVETIDTSSHSVQFVTASGAKSSVSYDRLILAAGSVVNRPQGVIGLDQHAFDIDSLHSAANLESHLEGLSMLPSGPGRDTVVVCGGGFTGIELAAELPKRLAHISNPRVVLVESANDIGPELGPGPRPTIEQALSDLGIEVELGAAVAEVDPNGVTLSTGERIPSKTVVWTAGVRATTLAQQIPGPKDALGRVHVDRYLRAPEAENVFVTGDAAYALADPDDHHYALMSCQHSLQMGRVSGHNAAAEILGEPMVEYSQPAYNCCLDLGSWGAVIGTGWERDVQFQGGQAKKVKEYINRTLIYPPESFKEAIGSADPVGPGSDELIKQILEVV
ncbi:hypothetical protein CPLU01_09345 [Colletotrichum plurivorum]|uniref:FAD/NAD(P)-binding domain-containing protein n=1 Tax=Colletotrichum plurivorum TaxID=2175906 RepID=A0A8H6K9K4_9PEZI|nr:hypothetical protein CPLU01_09345 [Colletotrichum plurivorum]